MHAIMIDDRISVNKTLFTVVGPNIVLGRKASNRYFTVLPERGARVLHAGGSRYIILFTSRKERGFHPKFFGAIRDLRVAAGER